ncbi:MULTISPECIES: hypothetical protein [Methylobacterium]|jgi:hypothetical protein|uniref:Uncharacterized protein n=1 Tax=Methylobacterium longum TaxID=767694 RepID=A0ABT8ASI1_9HYPH|nr:MULTISPECIES: hypothetical protein [Methylobacterium]MCJ2100723.1 hypothetical protein [Methylobacterium sp. E-046]MDN3572889.1 hypothetical protein [Methylobacterium longum]GJE09987.1 hypothetical protein FOHLNKBM_1016 [Methylobacterium longum]
MLRFRNRLRMSSPSLAALGIVERSAAKAHASLIAAGWAEIGYGYHGSVHAHPNHPDIVVRLARKADGFGDYVALLRRGFAGSDGPHAPRVHDLHVSRCGALMTVSARLTDPTPDTWWLAYAHAVLVDHPGVVLDEGVRDRFKAAWPAHEPAVDHASFDGVRESFRAAWPGYEAYVASLRAASPRALDPNVGNVLVGRDGSPVVNDPLCDDGFGLWRSPLSRLTARFSNALRRVRGELRGRTPAAA